MYAIPRGCKAFSEPIRRFTIITDLPDGTINRRRNRPTFRRTWTAQIQSADFYVCSHDPEGRHEQRHQLEF